MRGVRREWSQPRPGLERDREGFGGQLEGDVGVERTSREEDEHSLPFAFVELAEEGLVVHYSIKCHISGAL